MTSKKTFQLAVAFLFLLFGLTLPQTSAQQPPPIDPNPQDDNVNLELERGQGQLHRLAFPPFRGTGALSGAAAEAAREMEATVRQDLQLSGYFEIQGPQFRGLSGDISRDLSIYQAAGSETLLLGDVRDEGDRIVLEGRLYELRNGQPILAKRYRGELRTARRIGHTFADEVIRYLTGRSGLGLTSIAFTSDRTGHKEIFLMDYDGASPRRVTGHRSTSMSPAWSRDGSGLAYTSFFRGAPGVYFAELSSGRKRPVIASGSFNTSPSFSPDGGRVAFARSVNGNVEIFTSDHSGGGLQRLTHSNAIDTNPAWSPKGGEIAFTSSRGGNPHIYVMDAEGTNQRKISSGGTYNDGAAWSPDGDRVAYATRLDGRFQIAVTNVVTRQTDVLTSGPGENESPTFSPDGRKIAFTSRRGGSTQIYVMDADGRNVRQITREGNNDMADWSPLRR
jgi:TolB protein